MYLNRRSGSFKLIVFLLLFSPIAIIAAKWGYDKLYNRSTEFVPSGELIALLPIGSDSTKNIVPGNTGDSLKEVNAAGIKTIDDKDAPVTGPVRSGEVANDKQPKDLAEINRLKATINDLLKIKKNNEGFESAKQKIGELQGKVNELTGRNDNVEKENKELYSMLKTISDERKSANMNQPAKPIPAVYDNKTITPEKSVAANYPVVANVVLEADDLQLSAMTVLDNKELETFQALQTDKFVGSFTVKNNNSLNGIGSVVVVVQQPDGQVLQKSAWESGSFESPEGKKIYSCKLYFEYNAGEPKRVSFTLNAGKSIKGNYVMQLYFKGKLIGKIYKTLL